MRWPSSLVSSTRSGESVRAAECSQIASSELAVTWRLCHDCWRFWQWLMAIRYSQVRAEASCAELVEFAERLEENVVGGVLRLLRIGQKSQGQIINGATVLLVKGANLLGRPVSRLAFHQFRAFGGIVHECFHHRLDMAPGQKSRASGGPGFRLKYPLPGIVRGSCAGAPLHRPVDSGGG